ncbi:MAG TPA: outer membrane beta-barrel protein [Candidatus Acidoferrum sp.]|nr:outer membrane beta-barrel protein [Candidatus Acidoferrum sp.]
MKWLGLVILVAMCAIPALAQDEVPSIEVGGGYTFRSYNNPNGPRLSMNGWDGMADYMLFWKWLSVAGQVDGTYKDDGVNGNTSIYSAMAGPQFYPFGHRRITLFGQALFGEGYTRYILPSQGGYPKTTFTSNAFAWQVGGGVDYAWKQHWSIRVIQFDYEDTRFFHASPSQGNYKISVGIMYRFGKLKRGR